MKCHVKDKLLQKVEVTEDAYYKKVHNEPILILGREHLFFVAVTKT